ncbi:unnamed protein product [Mycena citricolor]|uniref:Chromo domain-containing protein n=1 Tax=Mycena citricolor TaxID=2018698 RepID=A0AAD2Q361_9AGAR|nr:unnamed protein product [Mycena citricolor]
MKIGVQIEYKANHMRHLQLLQILMDELPKSLANACYAADVYETIAAYPGMAAFSAYQLFLALSYSELLDFSANDFVVAGPGALSGLTKMFGSSLKRARGQVPDIESDILRWMVENQREQFRSRGLQFSFLRDPFGDEHELDVADFEHAVCEVDKYARKAHPMIKGIGSRTGLRALFSPSSAGLPPVPALPEAWGSKRRQQWRPREAAVSVEKRYIVDEILQVRPSKNKRGHGTAFEYLVSWWGYSERTWEPESSLQEDVPNLLADYKRSRGI